MNKFQPIKMGDYIDTKHNIFWCMKSSKNLLFAQIASKLALKIIWWYNIEIIFICLLKCFAFNFRCFPIIFIWRFLSFYLFISPFFSFLFFFSIRINLETRNILKVTIGLFRVSWYICSCFDSKHNFYSSISKCIQTFISCLKYIIRIIYRVWKNYRMVATLEKHR